MSAIRVLSITTNLARYGGAQKVLIDVHNGIKDEFECKIIGRQKFEELHPKYGIAKDEYIQLKNISVLKNSVVLVHARNVIPFLVFIRYFFLLRNTKLIYTSHNVYSTLKHFTFFPKTIVSISEKVTENLITYFRQNEQNIHLIYNGIKDQNSETKQAFPKTSDTILILYPARVNGVKRQLEIVERLREKLSDKIEIHFAGIGDDFERLQEACSRTTKFKCLGFVENMDQTIPKYHYLMLYSHQEGLPIALLEGTMHSRPLLINDVGGNLEIGEPGRNGIELAQDWDTMINQLNYLPEISQDTYDRLCTESRRVYLEKFQTKTMIEKYKELIYAIQ